MSLSQANKMNIPHRCPVCDGSGELKKKRAKSNAFQVVGNAKRFVCHGCQGTGIVWELVINPDPQPQPYITIPSVQTWSIGDGVAKCADCKEPIFAQPAKGCKYPSSHSFLGERVDQPQIITDHICGSASNPPKFCQYCFDQGRYYGSQCSCSPQGMPHSEDCKGLMPGQISYEQIKDDKS